MFRTIRSKIAVLFSIAIVFICIMFGVSGFRVLRDYLVDMQQKNQERLSASLCSAISFFREECENDLKEVLEDPEIWKMVQKFEQTSKEENLKNWMETYADEHEKISNVYLITSSYKILEKSGSGKTRTYLIDRISTAERYGGDVVWDSGYDTESMMLFGKISSGTEKNKAYLFFRIENSQILKLFNQFRFQNSQRFSLKGVTNGFEVTEQGFYYNYYDNYKELLHTEIMMDDWELRTWSDKAMILGPTRDMSAMMVKVTLAAWGLGIALSICIAQWITKPLKSMKRTMVRYGAGDFSARVPVKGKDEIAAFGHLFNQMAEQISDLVKRIKTEEDQRRRRELQTMIYQINPHFLYNTLDSVSILARRNKDAQVADIVTNLSRLFRLGLHQGRECVTVRDELSHVTYYLKIQKIRFEEYLDWKIEAPPEVLDYKTMKFILQPIVENAINHGIRAKGVPGYVGVSVRETEEDIIFTVSDTGNGMSPDAVRILRERIERKTIDEQQEQGFGLWNVNQRIKLYYGEEYGITIESVPEKGTNVSVRIHKT
ncbi:MAG TPA: sensor histidine kinase [Candidatus Mediterraneibacter surreyensis]|nr:sensor histidine kinase [Candidatus Mediterraneibacter surreyensis]